MRDFPAFADLVQKRFAEMAEGELFVVDLPGDDLWAHYLESFPEGTNPIFRERTEHDCNCCKGFIRRTGNLVDGEMGTVWDLAAVDAPEPYAEVAQAMASAVKSAKIAHVFRTSEGSFGAQSTLSQSEDGGVERWNHFYTGPIPQRLRPADPNTKRGEYDAAVQVFRRGLEELAPEALETIQSLIEANNLYRGEERLAAVKGFIKLQKQYQKSEDKDLFVWSKAMDRSARFRNSVIGTLAQDISAGEDIDKAVRAFEAKVAPTNYKRTTAVITPGMVKKAMETIAELDLESALERRFARIDDISVNDVLWVDSSARPLMKGGIGEALMKEARKVGGANGDAKHAVEISIEDFMANVLPGAKTLDLLFEGQHLGNLMSLTAPVNDAPKQLFRWGNDFAWSYAGNVADSELRRAVQALGGRVDGAFRFSHTWNYDKRNASLMDLHVFMPGSLERYSEPGAVHNRYGNNERVGWNHRTHFRSGGVQDVDYVQPAPSGYVPVENITFPDIRKMPEGKYICKIHNWALRQPTAGGFRAEIEFGGTVFEYEHLAPLRNKEWVTVATVTLKRGEFSIEHHMPCGTASQDKWGLSTENYVKVNAVTLSPNYWGDSETGNKHHFFVVDGCENDEATRGIYNEFLHPRLETHRKVFEVIGDKTKCQPTEGQLSGLGFSSTKKDSVVIRVDNKRPYRVRFGA